jgi:hypothetical protein
MEPMEPDEAATAVMDEEVATAEPAVTNTEATADMAKTMAADMAEAMATTVTASVATTVTSSVATTMPTAAGIGDLGKADDGGNKQC